MGGMLLSIGSVKSTTRLNFNSIGACASAADAVASASEAKTTIRAFVIVVLRGDRDIEEV
jgi:hypothetical protein